MKLIRHILYTPNIALILLNLAELNETRDEYIV